MSYLRVEPVGSSESDESWSSIGRIELADDSLRSGALAAERAELSRGRDGLRRSSSPEAEDTAADDGEIYTFNSPSIQRQSSFERYVEEQYLITLVMVNEKSISSLTEDQQETVRKLRAEIKGPPPEEMQAFREVRYHHSHTDQSKQSIAPVRGDNTAEREQRRKKGAKMVNAITPGDNDAKMALRKTDNLTAAARPWGFKPKEAKQKTDHVTRSQHQKLKVSKFGKSCTQPQETENQQLLRSKQLTRASHQALTEEDASDEGQRCRYIDDGSIVTLSTQRGVQITDTAKYYSGGCGEVQEVSSLNTAGNRLLTKNENGTDASAARPTNDNVSLQFKKKSKRVANSKIHGRRVQNLVPEWETVSTMKEFRVNRLEKIAGVSAHQPAQEPSDFCSHRPSPLQNTDSEEGGYASVELGHPAGTVRLHNLQAWDNRRALPNTLPPLYYGQNEAEMQEHVMNKNPTALRTTTGYLQQFNEPRRSNIRALQTPVFRPSPQKPAGSYLLRHLRAGHGVQAKHRQNDPAINCSTLSTPGLGYSYCSTHQHAPTFHGMPTHLLTSTDQSHASVLFPRNPRQAAIYPRQQGSLPVQCSWPPQSHSLPQQQQSLSYVGLPCDYQTNHVIHAMPSVPISNGTWVTAVHYGGDYSRDPRFQPSHAPIDKPPPGPPPYSFQPNWWPM